MRIHGIVEIFDNGEFVTIVTSTGSAIHLPTESKHSIVIESDSVDDSKVAHCTVDLHEAND